MVEDEQKAAGTAGPVVLHVLPVGGGIVAFSQLPGAGGDYRGDLEHLSSWRPAMVISLVSHVEMLEAGAKTLGQDVQDKGTRWVHMPIKRGEAPNATIEEAWPRSARRCARRFWAVGASCSIAATAKAGRA